MPFSALPSFGQIEQLARWLFGDALSWAKIVQVPALFLTGAVAWLLCHPVRTHVVHGSIAIPTTIGLIGSYYIGR